MESLPDSFSTVVPRGIKQGQQTNELPWSTSRLLRLLRYFLSCNSKRTKPTLSILVNHSMHLPHQQQQQ